MNHPLIIPNLHVILVHYPLGLFVTGLAIELLSFLWPKHAIRMAGRCMILLGGLSMVPATLSGIYALHDVAMVNNQPASDKWADAVKSSPLTAEQWQELVRHVWLMSIATGMVVVAIVAFLASSDRLRRSLYWLTLAMLLAGAGLMGVGAWFAGEAIYRLGVAVDKPDLVVAASQPAEKLAMIEQINVLFPPLQNHIVMAGYAVAIALAAVGLSIRNITGDLVEVVKMNEADSLLHSMRTPVERPVLYPAKFWLVAAFVFIGTSLLGWYFLGSEAETFRPKALWHMAIDNPDGSGKIVLTRSVAHVSIAGTLMLTPFILAILAKWAPKQKILLGLFTLILLAAITAQLWTGLLLLFDGSGGKITGFN